MRKLRLGWMRMGAMATATACAAAALVVFGVDNGHSAQKLRMLSGSAWLSSAKVGQATLLDGSSAEVSAQVQVAPAGAALDVVQQGATAYAVDRTAGTVRRVDGATFELTPPQSPIPDARGGLIAVPGADALYTLDTERGVLAQTDPRTLARRGELLSLTTQLGAGTAAVDVHGRLWVIDTGTGDLIRVAGGKRTTHRQVVQGGQSVLTLADGAPVVVDTAGRKAITLDPDTGRTRATMELDLRPDDQIEISGSPNAPRLYVVASRGALYTCELIASSCDTVIALGAGSRLGAAVEAGNRLFVPDYGSGQVWIVDLSQRRVVARPEVLKPAGQFQLLTRDGIVFYNDPNTERAGVIHLDGAVTSAVKYDPNDPAKGVHSPDTDPSAPPNPQDPPSNPDTPPGDPNQPQPDPTDPRQPNPTDPQPRPNDPRPNDPPNDPNDPSPDPNDPRPADLRITMSNTEPVVDEPVTLQVTNPDGPAPTAARWTFGDNGQADGLTVQHQWTAARTHQLGVQATMPDGRTATASASITVQARPTVRLTVNIPGGGGTIMSTVDGGSGGGISCPGECTAEFDPAERVTVTLIANPDADHQLGNWSGACSGSAASCNVIMDADRTVGYAFRDKDPPVIYTMTPPSGGTISVNGVTCPGPCTYTADRGQNVNLAATPDAAHTFGSWTNGCANPSAPSCTIPSETNRTIGAAFTPKRKFRLTLYVTALGEPPHEHGTVTGPNGISCRSEHLEKPTCQAQYFEGEQITLVSHPDPGWHFHDWSGDRSGTGPTITLTVDKDLQIWAVFEENA